MKYIIIISCFAILFFSSFLFVKHAGNEADLSKDTLIYTYHTINQADAGFRNTADSAEVNIVYPVFKNQQALNIVIRDKLLNKYRPNNWKDTSFKQAITLFIKSYKEDKLAYPLTPPYSLELSANIIRQDSALVVVQLSEDAFDGGAHGNSSVTFINWNSREKRLLAMKDIFITGYYEKLSRIAERIFRKQEHLSDTASLSTNYFFDKGRFSLNDNFSITPSGLKFLYNEYEIKSYAEGTTQLLIPYSQIKSLLKPNTVLAQYFK